MNSGFIVQIVLLTLALVCMILATALTAAGSEIACTVRTYAGFFTMRITCDSALAHLSAALKMVFDLRSLKISIWDEFGQLHGDKIYGQFFVFGMEIIMTVVVLVVMVFICMWNFRKTYTMRPSVIMVLAILAVSSILLGGLEAWYASGFNSLDENLEVGVLGIGVGANIDITVRTWAVASGLLLIDGILFSIAAAIAGCCSNSDSRQETRSRQQFNDPYLANSLSSRSDSLAKY